MEWSRIVEEVFQIVHGKPRHSQSQGTVERANQDVENMLGAWQQTNETTGWAEGLRVVQFMKNRVSHSGIKCSPYEAMFGAKPRVNLSCLKPPVNLLNLRSKNNEEISSLVEESSNLAKVEIIADDAVKDGSCAVELIEKNIEHVNKTRKTVHFNLEKQAEKMLAYSNSKFGETVKVPVPDLDRGRSDSRNILAIVLEKNENDLYKLGTTHGIINQMYSRNQFSICKEKILYSDSIPGN